jgi:hypothetical protein
MPDVVCMTFSSSSQCAHLRLIPGSAEESLSSSRWQCAHLRLIWTGADGAASCSSFWQAAHLRWICPGLEDGTLVRLMRIT